MKKIIVTLIVCFISIMSFAQNKNAKTIVEVDGICGMCKARIEKAAFEVKGVKSAVWNTENHQLKLIFDERKTNVKTICENIAKAGHDTRMVTATEEAYNSVHDCCRYRDEEVVSKHQEN